ncbi:alpha/beta hydrolase [Rhodopirellula halodulae]|uniref:alpha/beta hydrolase n=1 Tax=Rhodopirellula halodulae TaxID=2894198 RepID=UPI001E4790A1|nr:alpha/beta hydrolase [Rhodopirellula sp. JC737]MCC9658656.1 alpha/beta hydrolase [Rhodopirellula sp. JC737]
MPFNPTQRAELQFFFDEATTSAGSSFPVSSRNCLGFIRHWFCSMTLLFVSGLAGQVLAVEPAHEAEHIALWKDGAPGSVDRMNEAPIWEGANLTNVHHPTITPYVPAPEKSTGTAVLICPGGGHKKLCLGHEGDSLAKWFAERGIAAFVLRYRLCREPNSPYTLEGHAMDDTHRAIRMIRSRAEEWNLKTDRIGILGFSAGGELAAYSAMNPQDGNAQSADPIEQVSSRPDFHALIYPGKSATFEVHEGMSPAFVAFGYHDREDIAVGMAHVYLKYKAANVPCEMHVYSEAGHGFGFREDRNKAALKWPERLEDWLIDRKLLTPVE